MSLSKKIKNIATTASLIGTLAATSVFGVRAQEPQPVPSQTQEQRISRKYPKEFGFTINSEPSSIVYTYLGTISSQEYNRLFERDRNIIDMATELTEKISEVDAPIDLSSLHEKFRIPNLTEEDRVDIYQVKPEIPITTIDGSQSAGEMFSVITFVKSNKPEITYADATIRGNNLDVEIETTDKTDYKDQERNLIQSIRENYIQGKLPPEDLTVLLGETENSDLIYKIELCNILNEPITTSEKISSPERKRFILPDLNINDGEDYSTLIIVKDEVGNQTKKRIITLKEGETLKETEVIYPIDQSQTQQKPLDGDKILFSLQEGAYTDIYVMNQDGTNKVNLTNTPNKGESDPTWSPDKRKIAFSSDGDICTMNQDGNNKVNLTNTPKPYERMPRWTPDGRITFTYQSTPKIYMIMNQDGSNKTELTKHPNSLEDYIADLSPDRSKIVYSLEGDIYVKDLNGRNQRNLTNTPNIMENTPVWSPDGTKIAFVRNIEDIYAMNIDGSNLRNITKNQRGQGIFGVISW